MFSFTYPGFRSHKTPWAGAIPAQYGHGDPPATGGSRLLSRHTQGDQKQGNIQHRYRHETCQHATLPQRGRYDFPVLNEMRTRKLLAAFRFATATNLLIARFISSSFARVSMTSSEEITHLHYVHNALIKSFFKMSFQILQLQMNDYKYHYLFTTFDIERFDLEDFKYNFVNMTAFRVVNVADLSVQKVLREMGRFQSTSGSHAFNFSFIEVSVFALLPTLMCACPFSFTDVRFEHV